MITVATMLAAVAMSFGLSVGCQAEEGALRPWPVQIREWRAKVHFDRAVEGKESAQAKASIRGISAPEAVPALEAALKREKNHNARFLYYEALANIPTADSLQALVRASVEEVEGMREPVARLIGKMPNVQEATPHYIRYLRSVQYANYAAEALSASGITSQRSPGEQPDPTLTHGLIQALVLNDLQEAVISQLRIQHYDDGLPGHGIGTRWRVERRNVNVKVPIGNAQVLETLQEYTQQNYGYDQASWRQWYSATYGEDQARKTVPPRSK